MKDDSRPGPPATPVKRAYEQVAEQMRQWIATGFLQVGDRLPNEAELCKQFSTSRSTVREALRLLAAERLIVTQPGARGGSVVSRPSVANVTADLTTWLAALVVASDLSIPEMLEARVMMEVPAAGIAAEKHNASHIAQLETLIPKDVPPIDELYEINRAFHATMLEATGNRLLPIVVLPVFEVSARRGNRKTVPPKVWATVIDEHRTILDAIAAGDAVAAEEAMRTHLLGLAFATIAEGGDRYAWV